METWRHARLFVKTVASLVLIAFLGLALQPLAIAAQLPGSTPSVQQPQSNEERLAQTLDTLQDRLEKVEQKLSRKEDASKERDELKALRRGLDSLDEQALADFEKTWKHLQDKNLPAIILKRHEDAVATYRQEMAVLKANLDDLDQVKDDEDHKWKAKKAKDHLKGKHKQRGHTPLDPTKLPFRTPDGKARKPKLTEQEYKASLFPDRVQVASSSLTGDMLMAAAVTAAPTPADLASSEDVQITEAIQAKAQELGHNTVNIYNWVRNTIEFVPTYGSIQGSHMCLLSKQCNDADTASLLIALLRASNIPARYVVGTIEVPIERVVNWVGGFQDPRAAVNFIASGGTPVVALISGGRVTHARLEHVWVEAFVDYFPSRGSVQKQGDAWVAMDASFKQHTYKNALDVQKIGNFDEEGLINQIVLNATKSPTNEYITNISTPLIQGNLESVKAAVKNHITTNLPDGTIGDIIGEKKIIASSHALLPASLPYKVLVAAKKISQIPDQMRHKINIEVTDSNEFTSFFSNTFTTSQLAGKRVTLSYMPASQADANTIEAAGGYYRVKPYLVHLKPLLKIDGATVTAGTSTVMGDNQKVIVTFFSADGAVERVVHDIPAGTFAALGLDLQRVPVELTNKSKTILDNAKSGLGVTDVALDDLIGETLHMHSLGFFQQVEAANRIAASSQLAYLKHPSEMLVTFRPSIGMFFGLPNSIKGVGMNVDVKRYLVSPVSLSGNPDHAVAFMLTTGSYGSAMEHGIFEQSRKLNTQGVSAVKIISIANERGIPIFNISPQNIGAIAQLQIGNDVKIDIQNAVLAGKTVIVPQQTIQHFNWTGDGYIIVDPVTGAAAYMISGGLAGGGTAQNDDPLSSAFDTLLTAIGFIADFASAFIDELKYLSKVVPRGVAPILDAIGNIVAVLSAFAQAFDMYNKTNCAWKAGAAASLDFLVSILSGMLIAKIMAMFIVFSVFGAILLAVIVVVIVALLAALLINLLLWAIENIPYCFNESRRTMLAWMARPTEPIRAIA